MFVIGINGSPKAHSNTGYLVRKVLEGAEKEKAQTKVLDLGKMEISGCKGCNGCKDCQICVVKDDMFQFYNAVKDVNALVIGTPIYFDHISGQLKNFFDRLYCYLDLVYVKDKSHLPKDIRAGVVITYEMDDKNIDYYDYVFEWIEKTLKNYYDIETVGVIKINKCYGKLIVDKNVELINRANELGKKLVS